MPPDKEITSTMPDDRPGARGERPVALVTGITGQDGSYLAEFLLDKATRCTASSGGLVR